MNNCKRGLAAWSVKGSSCTVLTPLVHHLRGAVQRKLGTSRHGPRTQRQRHDNGRRRHRSWMCCIFSQRLPPHNTQIRVQAPSTHKTLALLRPVQRLHPQVPCHVHRGEASLPRRLPCHIQAASLPTAARLCYVRSCAVALYTVISSLPPHGIEQTIVIVATHQSY